MAHFLNWLQTQQNRKDPIGRFAYAATLDKGFPKRDSLDTILSYLRSKQANDKLLQAGSMAFAEFTQGRKKEKKPAAKAQKPAPAAKPAKAAQTPKPEPAARQEKAGTQALKKAGTKPSRPAPAPSPAPATAAPPSPPAAAKSATRAARQTAEAQAAKAAQLPAPQAAAKPRRQKNSSPATNSSAARGKTGLPERLLPLERQLLDARTVLDSVFGSGYTAANPAHLIEYAKTLLAAEQNRMLHHSLTNLAEALHRIASRLDGNFQNRY